MTFPLVDDGEGYTRKHECAQMIAGRKSEPAIEMIVEREGKWLALCEDYYYRNEIFFCPFCGEKL